MSEALTTWLGERLLVGSLQGAAVIAVVWLVCRACPRLPASTQALLWWIAALKLALVFVPAPAVTVALLPGDYSFHTGNLVAPSATVAAPTGSGRASDRRPGSAVQAVHSSDTAPVSRTVLPEKIRITWLGVIVTAWISVLLVAIGQLVYVHRQLRGIVRRSVVWRADEIAGLANRIGLTHAPAVLVSDEITTPQVFGSWKPVVLIPADLLATITPDERSMTLCHELMHIRRRDIVLGWVPAIAERLFFFHPLARLAAREYVAARESACDAAVVKALDVAAADYGRLLVRLGIGGPGSALVASGSAFSRSSLKRRLQMLQHHDSHTLSRRQRLVLVAAAASILPLQLAGRAQALDPMPLAPPHVPVEVVSAPPAIATPERLDDSRVAQPAPTVARRSEQRTDDLSRGLDAPAHQADMAALPSAPSPEYVIGPGDVLTLTVWRQNDLRSDLLVRPDGKITVPLIRDVVAAGLTPEQLSSNLTQALSRFLVEPIVTVGVKAISSRRVSVTGGVVKPGQYDLLGPVRVLDVISLAGGLRQFVTGTQIVVIRSEGGRPVSFIVNYRELLNGSNLDQNILLRPGDTVLVPE
jgi:putative polysaccharide export protein (PEP-CTERM system associated)